MPGHIDTHVHVAAQASGLAYRVVDMTQIQTLRRLGRLNGMLRSHIFALLAT